MYIVVYYKFDSNQFQYHGPFQSEADAEAYGEKFLPQRMWGVTKLLSADGGI